MSSKTKIIIGVVIAAVVVVGGCNMLMRKAGELVTEKMIENASGGKAKVDAKDGSMTVTTSEGTVTTGGNVPEGWPSDVPVYAGAAVQFSGANMQGAEGGMALVLSSKDDASKVASYYKTELKAQGWTIGNTMEAQGNTVLLLTKGTKTLSLSIAGANGMTSITIGVQDMTQ